jgi:hypothetical protein
MPLGLAFWIIYLLCLIFRAWWNWPNQGAIGGDFAMFILIGILGWHAFGAPIHG